MSARRTGGRGSRCCRQTASPPAERAGAPKAEKPARREAAPVRDERCGTRDAAGLRAACWALYWVSAPKIAKRPSRNRRLRKRPAQRFHGLFTAPVDARAASPLCALLGIEGNLSGNLDVQGNLFTALFTVPVDAWEASSLEPFRRSSLERLRPLRGLAAWGTKSPVGPGAREASSVGPFRPAGPSAARALPWPCPTLKGVPPRGEG